MMSRPRLFGFRDSYNRLEWRTLRDPRFTKQCRLLQRGGSLAAHDARTPDHLYATMIHFQQRSQSSFQFLCLSLNQPNFSLSRCCAVLSYPRAARCLCRRRRSHFLPVPRGVLSLRPRATCAQARLYLEHTTATGRGEHHDTTRIMTSSPASSNIKNDGAHGVATFILVTALSEAPASRGGEVVSGRHLRLSGAGVSQGLTTGF